MKDQSEKGDVRTTEGARRLRAYLNSNKISITAFCALHGLDRIQVQRALNGERWKRITVDFAHAIHRATNGKVPLSKWQSKTARSLLAKAA